MKILAKSAFTDEQLNAKVACNADGIEIQLLSELINGKVGRYHTAEEVFDMDKLKTYDIYCVHAPILSFYGLSDVNLEDMVDFEDFVLLDQVFNIANTIGEYHNRKTIIIVHSELYREKMIGLGDTWKRVLNSVGCLLLKYPYTERAIENITPVRNAHQKPLYLSNNYKFDNVVMAKELRKQLHTDRVGTVLDICHARITDKYMNEIYKILGDEPEDYSLNNFFKENKDVIKLIHLADMKGTGFGKGQHGTPFEETEESLTALNTFIDLYKKYDYSCLVTLEVSETDFIASQGFRESNRLLLQELEKRK